MDPMGMDDVLFLSFDFGCEENFQNLSTGMICLGGKDPPLMSLFNY